MKKPINPITPVDCSTLSLRIDCALATFRDFAISQKELCRRLYLIRLTYDASCDYWPRWQAVEMYARLRKLAVWYNVERMF